MTDKTTAHHKEGFLQKAGKHSFQVSTIHCTFLFRKYAWNDEYVLTVFFKGSKSVFFFSFTEMHLVFWSGVFRK